jgi:LuxR family maltose regulon positive regulatory protein
VPAAPHAALPLPARHVPRPRLTRLLDAAGAQTILITAPAGYGKTTLAAEWLREHERVSWYRATPASADLAVFSLGLAEAVSAFAGQALRRVSQRLQVGEQPEHAVQPLAEVLADDLARWPEDAWLAIDDYHLVMQSPTVERFVAALLELAPLRLLVTSRRRPAWASARKLLSGELVELGPDQLAMAEAEAAQALGDHPPESVRALVAQARGWPALIGMAALTSSLEVPSGRVSDMLFRYFAEEVLRQQPPEVADFMVRASVPPSFTLASAEDVLGLAAPAEIVERLNDEGLVQDWGEGALGFHPLLRAFLRSRLQARAPETFAALVEASVAAAREAERWDEAFELAASAGRRDLMVQVTTDSLRDLLRNCRFETLERWVHDCEPAEPAETGLRLAGACLLCRSGQLHEAHALLRDVIARLPSSDKNLSVAWRVLGTSLYGLGRYEDALEAQLQARDTARNWRDLTVALWSSAIAASVGPHERLSELVAELEAVPSRNPSDLLLRAHGRVLRASRSTSLFGLWSVVQPLFAVEERAEPLARLKFLNGATYVALCRSDYESALHLGRRALRIGRESGIDDTNRAWPLVQLAAAELAVRDFSGARRTMREIEAAQPERTAALRGELEGLRLKCALFVEATAPSFPPHERARLQGVPESCLGEYHGLMAIALAALGDRDASNAHVAAAESCPLMIESHFYPRLARLIMRAREESETANARSAAVDLLLELQAAEFTDSWVIAVRCYPPLLTLVKHDVEARRLVGRLLAAAHDHGLAREFEYEIQTSSPEGLISSLTKREREVLGLIREGLTNSEIASRLYVSHSTAKVHVHNVLQKLGVRTRTQAVIALQEQESRAHLSA